MQLLGGEARRPGTTGRTQVGLALALMALLALFIVLQGEPAPPKPYDLSSPADNGLLALRLWLIELGYPVRTTAGTRFVLPESTRLFFVYPTAYGYRDAEAKRLASWVRSGNTLVIIGPGAFDSALQEAFGVAAGALTPLITQVAQQQPLLPDLAGPISVTGQEPSLDLSAAGEIVPVLGTAEGLITVAVQHFGAGLIWHLSPHHDLSNRRLRDPQQAQLLLPLLRTLPPGSEVRFDTYHTHGAAIDSVATVHNLQEWLYYTPWGWGLLWLMGVTALYLLLQGWRLGPPLPATTAVRRREGAEYVSAMANLLRRARQQRAVGEHYKQRFKRSLGRLSQVSPALDDEVFLAHWQANNPSADEAAVAELRTIFQTLDHSTDERQLIALVQKMDAYTQKGV